MILKIEFDGIVSSKSIKGDIRNKKINKYNSVLIKIDSKCVDKLKNEFVLKSNNSCNSDINNYINLNLHSKCQIEGADFQEDFLEEYDAHFTVQYIPNKFTWITKIVFTPQIQF